MQDRTKRGKNLGERENVTGSLSTVDVTGYGMAKTRTCHLYGNQM